MLSIHRCVATVTAVDASTLPLLSDCRRGASGASRRQHTAEFNNIVAQATRLYMTPRHGSHGPPSGVLRLPFLHVCSLRRHALRPATTGIHYLAITTYSYANMQAAPPPRPAAARAGYRIAFHKKARD